MLLLRLKLGMCLFFCALWLGLSTASEASQRTAALVRTDTAPVIDGVLDEPAWSEGVLLEPMIQTLPIEGAAPTERTEIRLLYDRDFLYLGIRMYDSDPTALIAKQMVHDADMTSDDRINLSFDTFNDHRNAYFFQINPAGTRSDALIENNRTFRRDWNGIWYAETSVDDEGWSAEFAIPFKTVSFTAGGGIWGFEAERQIRRKNEVARWANPSKNRTVVDVAGIGTLTGLSDVDGTGIDVVPNGSLRYTWDRTRQADGTSTDTDLLANPGAEVYYKFHPSVTAALAVNTDFIEAPVDDRRTELTRFPPFFPERRDFFLEDAGTFEFGNITTNGFPYFSRRIGRLGGEPLDIDAGLKLTGRLGKLRFGGLYVQVPPQGGIDRTGLSVIRVQRDVLAESAVGIIATHGDPRDHASNRRPSRVLRTIDTGFETEVVTNRSNDLESAILTFNLLELANNPGDKIKFSYTYDEERLLREPFEVDPGLGGSETAKRPCRAWVSGHSCR